MRRKYGDCQRKDGNCAICPLASYDTDCHGRRLTSLEKARLVAEMEQKELANKSGVNIRQIQRIELGESEAGNVSVRNMIALADSLGVDVRDLI